MGFHEVRFPTNISYRSTGGPTFSTNVIEVSSGVTHRVARWSNSLRRYDLRESVKKGSQIAEILSFFEARNGRAHGFRFKDLSDFTTATDHISAPSDTDELCVGVTSGLTVGDGTEKQFQIMKRYTSGGVTQTRTITKPVDGTVVVSLDGVSQPTGWSVNLTSGIITFTVAPGVGVVVRCGTEYDTPVYFDIDELEISLEGFDERSIDSLPLVEDRDNVTNPEEFFHGGTKDHGILSATVSITLAEGRLHTCACNDVSYDMMLPSADEIADGGPVFLIQNTGSATLEVKTSAGLAVLTLGANTGGLICISRASDGTKTWWGLA